MAPLDRAVALAQVDDVPVRVGEDLDLDVARVLEVALEVDAVVREELLALARGALERFFELVLGHGDAKALAASSARGLAGDRVADLLGGLLRGFGVRRRLGRARNDRDARVLHDLARLGLRAHGLDRGGGRADEDDAGVVERHREGGVLGQEAVAGVDGLGARLLCDLDDLRDVQVALGRRGRAEEVRLVGDADGVVSRSASE